MAAIASFSMRSIQADTRLNCRRRVEASSGFFCTGLRRVIRHPLCDRGTALLIYWRGGPGWYAQYSDRAETRNADEADGYDLSQEIERLIIQARFATYRFQYDPTNDRGTDLTRRPSDVPQVRRFGFGQSIYSGLRAASSRREVNLDVGGRGTTCSEANSGEAIRDNQHEKQFRSHGC